MKLIGELNRSFDNFVTLRGIAKMGDIEKISKPDLAYQRDLYKTHGQKMVAFLKGGEYTFYPELILSTTLNSKVNAQSKVDNLYKSIPQQTFSKISFDDFKIKGRTQTIKSEGDLRSKEYHCWGILETLDDSKKILNRIDGNHRLSATEESNKEATRVPFCIIFFRNDEEARRFNRILFTNINYKHLPLTSEENLRIILDKQKNGEYIYSDDDLKNEAVWFGKHFYLARKILEKLSLANLVKIKGILCTKGVHKYTRTLLVELFELLIDEEKITKIDTDNTHFTKIQNAFREIENYYRTYNYKLDTSIQNYQLLLVHFYFYYCNKLPVFSNWVRKNHIYELTESKPKGLIALFNKILESKKRTIFLAMDFDEKTKENYTAINNAIEDINSKVEQDLKLELMRIDCHKEGYSFTICDQILNQIENGGYLIADISLGNKNVYYELGYQMGLNKGKGIEQDNFLLVHNEKIDTAKFCQDKGFNIAHIKIVKASDSNDLREKVMEQLKIYYDLDNKK